MKLCPLAGFVEELESGSRPRKGITDDPEVPSLGGEHIDSDGTVRTNKFKYITRETFESLRSGRVSCGDILIVKDGATTGKTAYFDGTYPFKDVALNEHVFRLKTNPDTAFNKYVFWFLFSNRGQVEMQKDFRGATVGGISRGFVEKVDLPIPFKNGKPDLNEQKRIAAILDKADGIRRKRQQALRLADDFLRSVFLDMFGDPVNNPKSWDELEFSEIVQNTFRNGLSPSNSGVVEGEVFTLSAITSGKLDFKHSKTAMFDRKPSTNQLADENAFLMCRGNGNKRLVGIGVFGSRDSKSIGFPDTIIACNPSPDLIEKDYLSFIWNSPCVRRQIERKARTTNGTYKVNQTMLASIRFPVPSLSLQRDFARISAAVRSQTKKQMEQQIESENLFSSLQQRAFRGEL